MDEDDLRLPAQARNELVAYLQTKPIEEAVGLWNFLRNLPRVEKRPPKDKKELRQPGEERPVLNGSGEVSIPEA